MRAARKKSLFDEEDEREKEVKLNVNESYAKRFEHNQARMELERLQRKYPEQAARLESMGINALKQSSDSEESSDDEDEDEGLLPEKVDAQILETLVKIRTKDPSVYDKNAKFYSSGDEGEGEDEGKNEDGDNSGDGVRGKAMKARKKEERPMYLKDVAYSQAMRQAERGDAGETSSDEGEGGGGIGGGARVKTYTEEQQELKAAFLQSFDQGAGTAAADDEFGGVLKPRRRGGAGGARRAGSTADGSGGGGAPGGEASEAARMQELLDRYFGAEGGQQLGREDRFLRNFILNKGWVDVGDRGDDSDDEGGSGEEDGGGVRGGAGGWDAVREVDDDDDAAELAAADAFEAQYNFRYEEPGGTAIATYPRTLEGTVRKEDDRRRRAREARAARQRAAEEQRAAELRRLKNLKKAEIQGRLAEVQAVAGAAAPAPELLDRLLEGDFDPEAHDRAMAAAFGANYYDNPEGEHDEGVEEDEAFERQLRQMAEYATDDEEAVAKTFKAVHARVAAASKGALPDGDGDGDGDADGDDAGVAEAVARARAEVQRLLEEYQRLDYEDHVGGVPTRFRYKTVQPENYGLTPEELLTLDDKELNQVVGLKRVAAPYREDGGRTRPNYGKLNELRRERQAGGAGRGGGSGGWRPARDGGPAHASVGRPEGGGGGKGGDKRADPPAPLTEAQQRLASYAKPTLKPKGKVAAGRGHDAEAAAGHAGKKRKRDQDAEQQAQQAGGPQLRKAHKKNVKRAQKRAARKQQAAASASPAVA